MTTARHFRLFARTEQAALLDLPWAIPLEDWPEDRVVEIERGIGRHVVRFVELRGSFFALKELPPQIAAREYRLLSALERDGVPSVEAVGVADDRTSDSGEELEAVLITRYLEFALPYRLILGRPTLPAPEPSIRAGLSELLVRLHLVGFFWGDCSLSNALFRRDAGALSAYLVDAETSELHERLTDGQRQHDLDIAEENLAGELHDLAAELGREVVDDPFEFAASVRTGYDELWNELTHDEVFSIGEGHRLEERLRRLNALGFDVEEVELVSSGDEVRLLLHSKVVEAGHHRRRLLRLTGLDAQENQARVLLNDLTRYRAWLERSGKKPVSDTAAAALWLSEVFEPAIAAIPPELRGRRAPAEIFHELLEHRWFLSEHAGKDVGLAKTIPSYIENVLRPAATRSSRSRRKIALMEPDPRRWQALALVCVAFFMTVLDVSIVNVALPSIKTSLHVSENSLQWVLIAYTITFGGLLLLGGRAADLLGRRRMFMIGLVVFSAASLVCGLADSIGVLVAARAVQGVGAAIISPATLAIITTTFEEGSERNKALGIWGAMGGSGAAAGVLFGGILTKYAGWEWIFFVNVPVGALVLALTRPLVRESRIPGSRASTRPARSTITSSLALLVYAISKAPEVGWASAGRSGS